MNLFTDTICLSLTHLIMVSKHGLILPHLLNKCENHIFVSTFSCDSHFGLYLLFSPLLLSILKNAFHFSHFRQYPNGKVLGGRRNY